MDFACFINVTFVRLYLLSTCSRLVVCTCVVFADFNGTTIDNLKTQFMAAHTVLSDIRQSARRSTNVDEETKIKIEGLFSPRPSSHQHGIYGSSWELTKMPRTVYKLSVSAAVPVLSEYAEIAQDLATLIQCIECIHPKDKDQRTTSRLFSLPEINFRLVTQQSTNDAELDQAMNRIRHKCAAINTTMSGAHTNTCHFPARQSGFESLNAFVFNDAFRNKRLKTWSVYFCCVQLRLGSAANSGLYQSRKTMVQ